MSDGEGKRLWSKDFIVVMTASAGIMFCNFFFLSTLPIYAEKISGNAAYAGLMTTVYTIAALIIRPFIGNLSDKYGRTKLLILGAFICGVACFFYNYVSVFIFLLLIRALQGVGFGIHTTTGGAVAADIIPKSRLGEGMGYFGLFNTFAVALAPGIALSIIGNGAVENFKLMFIIAAIICLASMILDCCITYERKNSNKNREKNLPQNQNEIDSENLPPTVFGFEYGVFVPSAVMILLHIAISSVTSFIALFAIQRNFGNIGFFFTLNAAGVFLSRLFMGKVADRKGEDIIIIPGLIVFAICFALIPLTNKLPYLVIIGLPLGLAQGAVTPIINSMMFKRCSARRRGTVSAAYFASIDIGYAIGSVMYGFVAVELSYYFVYGGAAVFTILSLIVYLLGIVKKREQTTVKTVGI